MSNTSKQLLSLTTNSFLQCVLALSYHLIPTITPAPNSFMHVLINNLGGFYLTCSVCESRFASPQPFPEPSKAIHAWVISICYKKLTLFKSSKENSFRHITLIRQVLKKNNLCDPIMYFMWMATSARGPCQTIRGATSFIDQTVYCLFEYGCSKLNSQMTIKQNITLNITESVMLQNQNYKV